MFEGIDIFRNLSIKLFYQAYCVQQIFDMLLKKDSRPFDCIQSDIHN